MTKVIVTGATGFLGSRLAKKLKSLGYNVIGLGRNQQKGNKLAELGIEFISVDLSDKEKLYKIFQDIDYVFHCAAKSSVWGDYKTFYRANVEGTKNIAELCLKNDVKRLIYVSSPSIYFDFKDKLNIKETEPPTKHPANNYIKTKIIAENIIDNAFNDGLDVITIRPRGIFGSGDSAILPRLLKANREKFIPKTRKDDILIDITHIENVVEAMILAMKTDKKYSGKKYNITNDENIYLYKTLENTINQVGEKFNSKYIPYKLMFIVISIMEFLYKFIPNKEPVFTRYSLGLLSFNQTLDISKAKNDLGYEPIISIEEGLKECLNGRI